jgi:hypothetical protein
LVADWGMGAGALLLVAGKDDCGVPFTHDDENTPNPPYCTHASGTAAEFSAEIHKLCKPVEQNMHPAVVHDWHDSLFCMQGSQSRQSAAKQLGVETGYPWSQIVSNLKLHLSFCASQVGATASEQSLSNPLPPKLVQVSAAEAAYSGDAQSPELMDVL